MQRGYLEYFLILYVIDHCLQFADCSHLSLQYAQEVCVQ